MPIIKCKMCGGDLRIEEGSTVCECEYCGTRQTVPSADNEKKLTLFSRAGRLLRGCEFDKAAGVFEAIVADFPEEAEAYWGLVLCKYGIEYVDDPATAKKIPTCHRSSFESVLDDPNFEQACENTDALARRVYRDEARQIEELRKRIIEVSGKEEPYDIFISYKETDENGDRTLDSVIAQDIYTELTEKGYRVFFSRISLEDKLGTEYEPYIFAALNSAKVMLVVGTDYENFDSVWVKNEWSRFLKLIASGQKKTLIPVFKNMDAYDMPKEFAKLAAQDMGKVGAMQDLVRGVEKLVKKKTAPVPAQQPQQVIVQQSGGPNTVALLKRGQQSLEDCNWDKAREFFDRVLDIDAENSDAFFGLFLAGAKCINEENYINKVCTKNSQTEMLKLSPATERIEKIVKQYTVKDYLSENEIRALFQYDLNYPSSMKAKKTLAAEEKQVFEKDRNLARAIRYSKGEETTRAIRFKARLYAELDAGIKKAKDQEAKAWEAKQKSYDAFLAAAEKKAETKYQQALERLEENRRKQEEAQQRELAEKEAARRKELAEQEAARKKAEEELERKYQTAIQKYDQAKTPAEYQKAKDNFVSLQSYKDSAAMALQCDEKIAAIKKVEAAEEEERQRLLRVQAERAKQAKKRRIIAALIALAGSAAVLFFVYTKVVVPGNLYKSAEALFESGKYEEAVAAFESLNGFKDSATKIKDVKSAILNRDFATAEELLESGDYIRAIAAFESLNGYNKCEDLIMYAKGKCFISAEEFLSRDDKVHAALYFGAASGYEDARNRSFDIWNEIAQRNTIAAGRSHTVVLHTDGTVSAIGSNTYGQLDVDDWANIVDISAGDEFTVGLRSDGTVIATGNNNFHQCDVTDWADIVAISAGGEYTVGLRVDGSVIIAGRADYWNQHIGEAWNDIVSISAGRRDRDIVGLRADGSIVTILKNDTGNKTIKPKNMEGWSDFIAVANGRLHVVGLRADGTVIATGGDYYNQCHVSNWSDIIDISVGDDHTVGLRSDGTVIATGKNDEGQCAIQSWTEIKDVVAGYNHTLGLRADGTLVATGNNTHGQCDVSMWTDIKVPDARTGAAILESQSIFRMKPTLGINTTKGTLNGVLVSAVIHDGLAASAGLKYGDVIISINGKTVKTADELEEAYKQIPNDKAISFEMYPGGKSFTVSVPPRTDKIGLSVVDSSNLGIIVSEVNSGGLAEKAGIKVGDMIVKIGDERVMTMNAYSKALDSYNPWQTVDVFYLRDSEVHTVKVTLEQSDFGILDDMPSMVEVNKGESLPLFTVKALGNLDTRKAFSWMKGDSTDPNSLWVGVSDSGDTFRGLRIETVYDEGTKIYTSTLWANEITEKAKGHYYCTVNDSSGQTLISSTVEIRVK